MGRTGDVLRVRNVCMLRKYKRAEGTQRHSGWATGWETGDFGFDTRQGQTFVFPQEPRSSLGAHPASCLMGTEGPFPWLKRSEREADYSPSPSAKIENA